MSEALGALLRALQSSGLAMDADQAMDSLWLALRMRERGGADDTSATNEEGRRTAPRADDHRPSLSADAARPHPVRTMQPLPAPTRPPPFALLDDEVDALETEDGRWISLERTAALSMGLELSRALRPLRRRVHVPGRGRLDVDATVRRVIDEFVFFPTFQPDRERWLDVLLVLDHGLSMIVWKETLDAVERLLRTSGAFRSMRSFWLETDAAAPVLTTRGRTAQARAALQLPAMSQSRARTVVLVVSDCVSPRWHDGAIPALLAAWGATLPVSLLQVTPDWYWPRTALGDAAEAPLFASGALTPNARLSWSSAALGLEDLLPGEAGPFAPIPLAAMTAPDIGRLARLIAGVGDGAVRGALFDLSWRGEETHGAAPSPQSRVARFHALATDDARRLASAFASSPIQTLGMLRLLRRDLLPGSTPFVEAEVLLGGLLRVRAEDASWEAGAALRLEFVEGVRSLLQDSATVPDILRVLRHASRDAGVGGSKTFSAWLSEPELRESGIEELGDEFAAVAAPVLRRLGGAYARGAQELGGRRPSAFDTAAVDTNAFDANADYPNADDSNADDSNAIEANAIEADAAEEIASEAEPAASTAPGSQRAGVTPSGATNAPADERVMRARALSLAPRFVGRERELERLLSMSRSGRGNSVRIAWVDGSEGVGKSALLAELVRAWDARFAPDEAFYWSFAAAPSVDLWMRTLNETASRRRDSSEAAPADPREALVGAVAQLPRVLLVLDAVERLEGEEQARLRDTLSLLAGSLGSTLSIVAASRTATHGELSVTSLHLEPLPRDEVEELIRQTVRDPRFSQPGSPSASGRARDDALGASDMLAALSGGNPAVLLSLLELLAMGITAEEIHEQFAERNGALPPVSVNALRVANPPFYDVREARGLLASADALVSDDKLPDALAEAERALGIAEQIGIGRPVGGILIVRALESMGKVNVRLGRGAEGSAQLQRALGIASEVGATELVESLRRFLDQLPAPNAAPVVRTVFHVYGRVAGVFFRAWTQEQARELQIEAIAENLPDGRIRVTASGEPSRVDTLEQRLQVGPRSARVTRVTREDGDFATTGADVFLSFAAADREMAARIAELLRARRLTVFLDDASLRGSESWRESLDAALDRAGCIVVLVSRAALDSDWVRREYRRGLEKQNLVPALLESSIPLPADLQRLQFVDLAAWDHTDEAAGFRALLAATIGVIAGEGVSAGADSGGDIPVAASANVETPSQQRAEQSQDEPIAPGADAVPAASTADLSSGATPAPDLDTLDLSDLEGSAWVQLTAGTFTMGSANGGEPERPAHTVGLSALRISRFPVTNRQYERFLKATGITAPAHWRGGRMPSGTRDHPVTNVNWHDASAFCSWLTSQLSSTVGGIVQLPTEAQWEYAARGSEGRAYPWGDAPPTTAHANFGRRNGTTTPVNAHPAGVTPTGIWDMAGNAWEWCRDWFGNYPSEAVENPIGAASGTARVIRGGSHNSEGSKLRATYRANRTPDDPFDRSGFRVVWTPAGSTPPPAP